MGFHPGRLLSRLGHNIGHIAAVGAQSIPGVGMVEAAFASPARTSSFALPSFPGGVIGEIGGAVAGGIIQHYLPGGGGANGCGCGSRGRDPCTGQKMSHQPAPKATLFGGCCPPGRVLRRKPFGRDVCIRKPRMNVANPHALRRAIRRARGFEKMARRVLGFTSPHKPKGRAYFKKGRRR